MQNNFSNTTKIHAIRLNILRYGDIVCEYCKKDIKPEDVNFDHIWPINRGGDGRKENIVICCQRCNNWKRDKTYDEFIICVKNSSRGQDILEQAKRHEEMRSDVFQKKIEATEQFYKNFSIGKNCVSCKLFPKRKTRYCTSGRDMFKVKKCGYYQHCDKETVCRS
jgi:hypothetical protein